MAADLNAVRDELLELVGAVWTDTPDNGIYRGRELAGIDWEQKSTAGELPVAVIDFDAEPTDAWGLGNEVDEVTVRIYRVVRDSETPDELMDRLAALRSALWTGRTGTLSTASILQMPGISDTMDTPVNDFFIRTLKPFYSGRVTIRMIAGTRP